MRSLFLLATALLILNTLPTSALSPVKGVAAVISGAESLRAWQSKQKWGKFKSFRYGVPIQIINLTDVTITVTVESAHCDWTDYTIASGETAEASCDAGGEGDNWYNYRSQYEAGASIDGGMAIVFWSTNGKIESYPYTVQLLDKLANTLKEQAGR